MRMTPLMGVIKNAREKSKITAAVSCDSLRVINSFFSPINHEAQANQSYPLLEFGHEVAIATEAGSIFQYADNLIEKTNASHPMMEYLVGGYLAFLKLSLSCRTSVEGH